MVFYFLYKLTNQKIVLFMKVDFEDYCKKWNVSFLKFENTLNIEIKYKKGLTIKVK